MTFFYFFVPRLLFGLVKFGEPKITVLVTIFINWLFVFFFFLVLNAQFKVLSLVKTSNNLPPKIYSKNVVDTTLL